MECALICTRKKKAPKLMDTIKNSKVKALFKPHRPPTTPSKLHYSIGCTAKKGA